jgi:hypothetical protein
MSDVASSPYFGGACVLTISYPDVAPGDRVKGRLTRHP